METEKFPGKTLMIHFLRFLNNFWQLHAILLNEVLENSLQFYHHEEIDQKVNGA